MTTHLSLSIRPVPDWRIADVAERLEANTRNTLSYYDASDTIRVKRFAEVRRDALAVLALMRQANCPVQPNKRCAVVGGPGYPWLLAALACIMAGVEIVAVPESLNADEMAASLVNLPLDFAVVETRFMAHACFAELPCLALDGLAEAAAEAVAAPAPRNSAAFSVVAFTSGSTSATKVKAFRIAAASTELFIDTFADVFELAHDDNWVVCHPFSHVVHFEYVIGGLCWGYNLVIAEPLRVILKSAEMNPSVLVTVPSVYEQIVAMLMRRLPSKGPRAALIEKLLEQPVDADTKRLARALRPVLMPEIEQTMGNRLKVMILGAAPSTDRLKRMLVLLGLPVYEGYGMSETNMLACNSPERYRYDTVGSVWPGVELRLDDEGVVQARLQCQRTSGYLNVSAEENARTFSADGWIDTGDICEIEDGFLRVTGRAKDIIITNRGKNINPLPIQSKLQEIDGVEHAMIFGNDKPFLVAVLAPRPGSALTADIVAAAIEDLNGNLPVHERIHDYLLLDEPLSTANELLTRSGKARRAVVAQRFAAQLEAFYV
jgi:long-chain acyl-CoA synthetase